MFGTLVFVLVLVTLVVATPIEYSETKNLTCTCEIDNDSYKIRQDYHYTSGVGIHKFHRMQATFNEARKICIEEGGHLAVINSPSEKSVLFGFISKSTPFSSGAFAFIGLHSFFSKNDWVTIQGDSIYKAGFDGWADGQPDNIFGGKEERCGALRSDGTLHDITCDSSHSFICELELPSKK